MKIHDKPCLADWNVMRQSYRGWNTRPRARCRTWAQLQALSKWSRAGDHQRPAQAPCLSCGVLTSVNKIGDACRHCGGYRFQATGDTVLRVVEMLVEDEW